jgi:hypothetical protein
MTPLLTHISNFRTMASAVVGCPGGGSCSTGLPSINAGRPEIRQVLTIVFGVAALISVLMIIIGALGFVTSGGSAENVRKARETLIFAVVGLVISLSAEAIVAFALSWL